MSKRAPVDLYLVHRQRFFRDMLQGELRQDALFRLIGFSKNASQAARRKTITEADLLLFEIDAADPQVESLERFRRRLRTSVPDTPIIALGAENPAQIVACLAAGAYGAVSSDSSWARMRRTLAAIARRRPICEPEVAAALLEEIRRLKSPPPLRRRELTPRQRQILGMLHLQNEEIAAELGLELATVKAHIHSLLLRMEARDRNHAMELARRSSDEDRAEAG